MALKEISISSQALDPAFKTDGVGFFGAYMPSIQQIIAGVQKNPRPAFERVSFDAENVGVNFQGLIGGDGALTFGVDVAGVMYTVGHANAAGSWRLYTLDLLSGTVSQVGATGPANVGGVNWLICAILPGLGHMVCIPDGNPYGLGGASSIFHVVDYTQAGWPLVGGTDSGSAPGGLTLITSWAAYKDNNSFYLGNSNGDSTIFYEMEISSLSVLTVDDLPRKPCWATYDSSLNRFYMAVHQDDPTGGADEGKIVVVENLSEVEHIDASFINPRFKGATNIVAIPRNGQLIPLPGRAVSAELLPGPGNATVLGSLENTAEISDPNGQATFHYKSPDDLGGEPVANDIIEFSADT